MLYNGVILHACIELLPKSEVVLKTDQSINYTTYKSEVLSF